MRLIYVALVWVTGLWIAAALQGIVPPLFWLILMAVSAGLLVAVWAGSQRWFALCCLVFAAAGLRYAFVPQTSDLVQYHGDTGVQITGLVIGEPDLRDTQVQLRVEVDTIVLAGRARQTSGLLLLSAPRYLPVSYGDRVQASGYLRSPAEFDTFSYADFLGRQGVFSIMSDADVRVIGQGDVSPFLTAVYSIKSLAHDSIRRALPDPQAALLAGILLGNERGIDTALADDFSAAGASHIIAISGFNMAVIAGLVMRLMGLLTVRQGLAAFAGITVLAVYTLLVGANAAVVRAAIMSSLLILAPLLRRQVFVPASLAFVALIMTAQQPAVLWDISFQLSFMAVLGLTLFAEPLSRYFNASLAAILPTGLARSVAGVLNESLVVTIAALITTLPLIVLYFQRLSLLVLPVNLLIIPVQAALLFIGGLATLLAFVLPSLAQLFYWMDYVLLSWSIGVVRSFARISFADVAFVVDPRLILLYYVLILGGAFMLATKPDWSVRLGRVLRKRIVWVTGSIAASLLLILMLGLALSRPDAKLHVWVFDIGHTQSILIQTPGGAHILVDGGRFPSRLLTALGDRLPFNDQHIDLLILTQPDYFDLAALPAVLERYDVSLIWTNGQTETSVDYAPVEVALASREVLAVRAGYEVVFGDGTRIEVLHPFDRPSAAAGLNEGAIMLRLTYKDLSFIISGDASIAAQERVLSGDTWPLASVLVLPQHGTTRSLSPEFLRAVQPSLVLVQADPANRLGDPDPDTLSLLGDIPVLRTDRYGTIHLWTDGELLYSQTER